MSGERQQERSGTMEIVGRIGRGRGWFIKSALTRRSALGVTPVIGVDPKGEWLGVAERPGHQVISLIGPGVFDPLRCVDVQGVTVKRGG